MAIMKLGVLPASSNSFVAPSVDFSSWNSAVVNDTKTSAVLSKKGAFSNGHQLKLTGTNLDISGKNALDSRQVTGVVNEVQYSTVTSSGETVHYSITGLDVKMQQFFRNSDDMLHFLLNGADEIHGTGFGETLNGYAGRDSLFGYGGDDSLIGGKGADILDGGEGIDTANYHGSSEAVIVDLLKSVGLGGTAQEDRFVSIENVSGSQFNDTLIGSDDVNILLGNMGDDVLRGGMGADVLNGGLGHDTADYSTSLEGVTVYLGKDAPASLGGEAAGDTFVSIENVRGSAFNDFLVGSKADNVLLGGAGNDTLIGGGGRDVFNGGEGVDTVDFSLSEIGVKIHLNGDDSVKDGYPEQFKSIENVTGSAFDDKIWGSAGANVLSGCSGNDVFHTGAGNDTVIMGEGNDLYSFMTGTGQDVIADFTVGQDVIGLKSQKDLTLDMLKAHSVNGVDGVLITLGLDTILLKNVMLDQIDWAHDFVFAA
jgi:Ca2+-binding RTX toxin-like protein